MTESAPLLLVYPKYMPLSLVKTISSFDQRFNGDIQFSYCYETFWAILYFADKAENFYAFFRIADITRLKMAENIAESNVTQQLIDMFNEIRRTLIENEIRIPKNFPIVEIDTNRSCELNCLGCTVIADGTVRCIEMLLKKPGTDEFYSKEALIATLLHEFAHCITPPSIDDNHSQRFYSNFEKILR